MIVTIYRIKIIITRFKIIILMDKFLFRIKQPLMINSIVSIIKIKKMKIKSKAIIIMMKMILISTIQELLQVQRFKINREME